MTIGMTSKNGKGQTTSPNPAQRAAVLPRYPKRQGKKAGKAVLIIRTYTWPGRLARELEEFKEALNRATRPRYMDELGDILFSVVNVADF
jgi:uncharacterized protein YabN with tetrapyrrole methylase and pyrophosphatase domain